MSLEKFDPIICSSETGIEYSELISVLEGYRSAIVLDGLYNAGESKAVANSLREHLSHFRGYRANNLNARFLGSPLNWDGHTLDQYFSEADRFRSFIDAIFQRLALEHPLYKVLRLLDRAWSAGAQVAINHKGEQFFAGDIRIIESAPVHNDFIGRRNDLPNLSRITEQLSWNLYFSSGEITGGQLEVFQKRWSERDANFKRHNEFEMGYSSKIIANTPSALIEPLAGRLVILRSTNYHRVLKTVSHQNRFSCTSFVGYSGANSPLLLWS